MENQSFLGEFNILSLPQFIFVFVIMIWEVEIADSLDCLPRESSRTLEETVVVPPPPAAGTEKQQHWGSRSSRALILGLVKFAC